MKRPPTLWTGYAAIREDANGIPYADLRTLTGTLDASDRLAGREDTNNRQAIARKTARAHLRVVRVAIVEQGKD